jgi:hypothetical protein
MQVPQSVQRYFQQIRPLSACDAEDGRIVGRMLKDLVESKPKDLAHAIRTFANNTAMLRESGFRHIGVMLEHLLTADAPGGAVSDSAIVALDPSSVMKKHAIAIGGVIASSVRRSHMPRTALKRIVESHPVLRAVTLGHVWFVPMLEVLTAREVASRRSLFVRRSSSIATAEFHSDADVDIAAQDGADEASSFSSAVTALPHVCVRACASHALGCARPAFRTACSTVSRTQLQVVPADVCVSEVVEDMPSSLAPNSAEMPEGGQVAQRTQEFVYEGDP